MRSENDRRRPGGPSRLRPFGAAIPTSAPPWGVRPKTEIEDVTNPVTATKC